MQAMPEAFNYFFVSHVLADFSSKLSCNTCSKSYFHFLTILHLLFLPEVSAEGYPLCLHFGSFSHVFFPHFIFSDFLLCFLCAHSLHHRVSFSFQARALRPSCWVKSDDMEQKKMYIQKANEKYVSEDISVSKKERGKLKHKKVR